MRLTAKSVFARWYAWYSGTTGIPLDNLMRGSIASRYKTFNTRVLIIKSSYNYDNATLYHLIDYHYIVNPLGVKEPKQMGNLELLMYAARPFEEWKKQNKTLIEMYGISETLRKLNEATSLDEDYARLLAEIS